MRKVWILQSSTEQAICGGSEGRSRLFAVTVDEVDAYLAGLEDPKRSTLEALRRSIRTVVPDAEECISYGMPAFRVGGKVVAGFAAFRNHLAYLPHSGEVLSVLGDRLDGYERTSGSLHFPVDEPLPDELVRSLVSAKLAILGR
jgi:uncharacterized protein YdhG (YjbR/CyaY superfamily)